MQISKHVPSEELHFFYFTLEKAPDAVFWIDAQANIRRVNEAACRHLGYSAGELTGLAVFDIDPNYNPQNWQEIIETVKKEGVLTFESRHRTKNGKILPVEITSNYFEFNGEDYFCAFVRDITHHKLIEKTLQEKSEHQLELFFSQSLDGFFFMMLDEPVRWDHSVDKEKVLDYVFAHQRMTKVNDAMLAQYGATREHFLGLTPNDFYQHDLAHGREVWRRFFDAGRLHIETDERKFDGTQMWVEGDYICFYDAEGRITGHFGIQRDVTERKRAEEALRQSNQRLKTLQEIDRAVLAARSPEEIAQAAMRHIHELVPCLRASVAEFDFEASKAVLIAIHAKAKTKLDAGAELTLEVFGDIGQLWLGIVHVVEDAAKIPEGPAAAAVRAEGVRSYINVPLRAQGELIGALNVGAKRPGRFSDEHIEIAQEVANSLAIAIRQARLYEQIEKHTHELEQRVAERTAELSEANTSLKNEIAERKKAEQALHDRLAIEQMISDISTRFITLSWQQNDEGIDYALARMGQLAGVDRSYLFTFSEDYSTARNTHEWCAPGVTAQIQNLQNLTVADFAWIFPKILRGETVYIQRVSELPAEAEMERVVFQEEEIQSLLVVPLRYHDKVKGLLGFDAVKTEKVWLEEDVRLLNLVSEIIANYFQRTRAEQAIRESEERLRAIGDAMPDIVFVIDEAGRYVEILTSEENLLYLSVESLKGQTFREVFPKPTADRFHDLVQKTIATGQSQVLEYELDVPAGQRWFEGRTAPLHLKIDGKNCIVFVARDITDRKRAEELESQNIYLQEEIRSEHNFGEIIGASQAMKTVFKHIEMVAGTDSTVLLTGETGTGKELIARAIHSQSSRKDNAMIKVNCGAMPAGLVESELFGHEKGAFTGATAQKQGKFELAHNGTIFLDEVGELPHETQVKLLRVLQEQDFERVGGTKTIKANVRIIAATNRDLQEEVRRGAFRSDLFFRLNIFPIEVPPLRARADDISLLVNYFIGKFSRRMGKRIKGINLKALEKLTHYHWPGNVRELANILERAVILCQGRVLQEEQIGGLGESGLVDDGLRTLEEVERQHILRVLEQTGGVLAGPHGAAAILGMNRSTLWSRMQKLGINVSKQVSGA